MQSENNKVRITSLLNFDVLASLAVTIGILIDFHYQISSHFTYADPKEGVNRYSYFMLAMTCVALFVLFVRSVINHQGGSFLWLPVAYVLVAFISTILSGLYTVERLPFRFVELFYWVTVMSLSYYAVLTLNTPKFHVALVVLAIPFLSYSFVLMRSAELGFTDILWLNPVFFIAFLMPVVLLLRSKIIKIAWLLLIFGVIVLSYKRMPIISFLMSILVYFYCLFHSGSKANISKNAAILIGAVMFIGVLAFSFRYMVGAFGLDWNARMGDIVSGGGGGRISLWTTAFDALTAQPAYLLIGHGKGAMAADVKWAHNDILEILYDFGFLGLVFYVLFAIKLIKIFFQMKTFRYKHLGAYAASLVWAFWGGMTDVFINYPYHSLGIVLFWGITIADFENAKKQECFDELEDSSYMCPDNNATNVPYA